MKLLLINPKFSESFWSFSWALNHITKSVSSLNSPLGLATLAALTPPDWEIQIVDENVEPIDWSANADIVGVCGMGVQVERQKIILAHFKKRGCHVVAGGSFASLCPETYTDVADTIVSGESEYIWPDFCADFLRGEPKSLYKEGRTVDLAISPTPRFDLLKIGRYQRVALQFSRGCPFQCEFCDIIVMFGRTPRNKTIPQVERELDLLRRLGVRDVFFVDDNFIGNKRLAKALLTALIDYQKRHNYTFSFGTEASINLAEDDELLTLVREANFHWVFMGIESPSEESLKETRKFQNTRGSMIEKIRKIYRSGIDVMAGFIVGFDADDQLIFDRQFRFITESGIIIAMAGLLVALPKTPLYIRLAKEGRLRDTPMSDNTGVFTNINPLRMSYDELLAGYVTLQQQLNRNKAIYQRLVNKFSYLIPPKTRSHQSRTTLALYIFRFVLKGLLFGGPSRCYYFVKSLRLAAKRPRIIFAIVTDWAAAISLQSFVSRYFEKPLTLGKWARNHFEKSLVQNACRILHQKISVHISDREGREKVWISVKDSFDKRIASILTKSVRRYARRCQGSVTLDFAGIQTSKCHHLKCLFRHLSRYRHQVHFYLTEEIYERYKNDLAAFHYTLANHAVL